LTSPSIHVRAARRDTQSSACPWHHCHMANARSASPPSWASSPGTRKSMQANRRTDTTPELRVRSALHRRGMRFRKDLFLRVGGVRARPDIVFTRHRVACFIDGCYWHRCPVHRSDPKSNRDYWSAKLEGNVRRDRRTDAALESAGWTVVRVWEHEDAEAAADRIAQVVEAKQDSDSTSA
jgi:DNA mismatch endonuclease (patch repair protein)